MPVWVVVFICVYLSVYQWWSLTWYIYIIYFRVLRCQFLVYTCLLVSNLLSIHIICTQLWFIMYNHYVLGILPSCCIFYNLCTLDLSSHIDKSSRQVNFHKGIRCFNLLLYIFVSLITFLSYLHIHYVRFFICGVDAKFNCSCRYALSR